MVVTRLSDCASMRGLRGLACGVFVCEFGVACMGEYPFVGAYITPLIDFDANIKLIFPEIALADCQLFISCMHL